MKRFRWQFLTIGLGRFAFWSVNRDRGGCDGQVAGNCSGIGQADLAFTRITAGF